MKKPATILVVDDDKMHREIEQYCLERHGYTVLSAASGSEALTLLEQHPIHLVISDFNMPGMKGNELAKRIQTLYPDVPIVILSSDKFLADYVRTLKISFMEKPINTEKFLHLVELSLTAHHRS